MGSPAKRQQGPEILIQGDTAMAENFYFPNHQSSD